jgi:hypothetical protein
MRYIDNKEIGKLERVPLREVWKHEAKDFTQWLQQQENIATLGEVLDLELVNIDREQSAGSFSIDLVAEDTNGGTVVIENQLEKSNHDHLGKLLTYLTAMGAKSAVWIVSDPRPEHVAAITWLNDSSSASFYMVKVDAVKIGSSPAAPLFTLIVGPSEEAQSVGQAKKSIAEQESIRRRWWSAFLHLSSSVTPLHAHITPGTASWVGVSSGIRGINFNYVVLKHKCGAEIYIDRGPDSAKENESIYDQLLIHKNDIEKKCGLPLMWERLEGKRACRIKYQSSKGGYRSPEATWPKIQEEVINVMDRLEKAVRPYLKRLKLSS